jgi:hypothetical protein
MMILAWQHKMRTQLMTSKLTEGNYAGDLKRLVEPSIHIDHHRSKMGQDDDIIVCSFKVRGKDPASDLMRFLETGYLDILDADVSPGEISPGNFLVFFELPRRSTAPALIHQIVEEVLNLTLHKMSEWTFAYGPPVHVGARRQFTDYPVTIENLTKIIPISPKEYRQSNPEFGQDTDEIASMKTSANIPVNQTAPDDDEMNSLKVAAGQI